MARSSTVDPIEKFRFSVTVISIDLSVTSAIDVFSSIASLAGQNDLRKTGELLALINRAGFSEVELPGVEISEIRHRENIDAQRFIKLPGLATYKPVVFKRGVTESKDLYNWYKLVNNELLLNNVSTELSINFLKAPNQNANFRKEVIITAFDRSGKSVKQWFLFNAFPISYLPGNTLDANSNEKLIEELSLTYEYFIEAEGGIGGISKEILKDAIENGVEALSREVLPPSFRR